ncbi:MAG: tail fiber domain-containing protein [Chitinophagaceae bacterium]
MKKLLLLLFAFYGLFGRAQNVGIGITSPNASAALDITNTSKGVLIPRMTTAGINAIASPAKGLMVYDSVKNQLMTNMGTPATPIWQNTVQNSGWSLSGNTGTDSSTQFIGSTDNNALRFRVNNVHAGTLDPSSNIFFGLHAGDGNVTGTSGIAIGAGALQSNQTGFGYIAIGNSALYTMTAGNSYQQNLAIGNYSMYKNTTGGNNTSVGSNSLEQNTSGNENVAIGDGAMEENTTGGYNIGIGSGAMLENTTGSYNVAMGWQSLRASTTGRYNIAIGAQSMLQNTTGSSNTAVGNSSLYSNTTGARNAALGYEALDENTTGNDNTAGGYLALVGNTTGVDNTAFGSSASSRNQTGNYNVSVGFSSGYTNVAGLSNTAIGHQSLYSNTSSYNTAVGTNALYYTTASQYNTAVGYNAGTAYNNGYNNVFVGANTDVNAAGYYNVIAIGQGTICTGSSQVTLGNGATGSYRAYANWSNISDGRFKKNIQENVPGLDFITKLHPVTYNLNATALDDYLHTNSDNQGTTSTRSASSQENNTIAKPSDASKAAYVKALKEKETEVITGFVAQDVETTAKQLGFTFSGVDAPKSAGDVYGLRYAEFVVPLVKAVQELNANNKAQLQQIEELKNTASNLQKQIDELKALIKK